MARKKTEATPSRMPLRTVLIAVVLAAAAGFGAVYVNLAGTGNDAPAPTAQSGKPSEGAGKGLAAYSRGQMATFVASKEPKDLPPITFVDGDGAEMSIEDWRGRVVLLNLWATWCGPCRKEMPTLDTMKADLAGDDFDLVAISVDRTGLDKPRAFLQEIGVQHLKLYNNSDAKLASSLKAFGLPTTLLLNRKGQEIGRLVGPAEWDSPEAYNLIKAAIAQES